MNKEQINLLKWFIKFVYADIDSLELGERVRLTAEVHFLLSNGLWSDFTHSQTMEMARDVIGTEKYNQETFARVKELQASFRDHFNYVITKTEDFKKSDHLDQWQKPEILSPGSFSLIDKKPTVQLTVSIDPLFPAESKQGKGSFLIRGETGWRDQISILSSVKADRSENMILLIFARCLNHINWSVFRKCEECDHWFIHATKREKKFCSNLCAARSANRARRKREKDTKAYKKELEQNAGRARKSYVRKVKGLSNIKVQRRPTKYK